jgi:hypothetical protein
MLGGSIARWLWSKRRRRNIMRISLEGKIRVDVKSLQG